MAKFEILEKDSILTASRTHQRETIEAANIEEAKAKAEEMQLVSGSEIGIYDENETPCAYFVGGEWTFTK